MIKIIDKIYTSNKISERYGSVRRKINIGNFNYKEFCKTNCEHCISDYIGDGIWDAMIGVFKKYFE